MNLVQLSGPVTSAFEDESGPMTASQTEDFSTKANNNHQRSFNKDKRMSTPATATKSPLSRKAFFGHGQITQGVLENLRQFSASCQRQRPYQMLDAESSRARAGCADEMGIIFANEIRGPLDAEGKPTIKTDYLAAPLEAATDADTLGTLAGALVSLQALDFFAYKLPLISGGKIMTDFSADPGELNQTAYTRKITVPGIVSYNNTLDADGYPVGWVPASAGQAIDAPIVMDELIGVPIPFSLSTLSSTQRNLFTEQAPAAGYALAKYFIQKIYGVCTAANYNSYAVATAADAQGIVKVPTAYPTYAVALVDFARSKMQEISTAFDCNEVPDEDRTLLLNAQYYGKAANDPSLVTFFAGQQAPEIVTKGVLPELAGFTPVKAPNFPGTNNRVGIALQKNGLMAKSRLPTNLNTLMPGAGNGLITQVVHPETGLAMLVVHWVDHKRGASTMMPCAILGAAKGDIRGGLVLTSQ